MNKSIILIILIILIFTFVSCGWPRMSNYNYMKGIPRYTSSHYDKGHHSNHSYYRSSSYFYRRR